MDGIARMGVLRVAAPDIDTSLPRRCEALAGLVAMILATRQPFGDVLARTMRTRSMGLQTELLWACMPPRTVGTAAVISSAVPEPAYDVGGDAYEDSPAGDVRHLTLPDAMGHDLASGGRSAAAPAPAAPAGAPTAASTTSRWRSPAPWTLDPGTVAGLRDRRPRHRHRPTGADRRGHPAPLLIRDRRIVTGALNGTLHPPLGLTGYGVGPPPVHTAQLRPGDQLLLFAHGVTDARPATGEPFGERHLADIVVHALTEGLPAPEALRSLIQHIRQPSYPRVCSSRPTPGRWFLAA
ncbi:SpoIIE family protein phosphatase [Streptomyces sp. NPDC058718]|uniref:SpoIIE family protein phosphatase n=1 Tax=Streptomyces sp. NPDC058718 TaxID=3346610 RepID=UPI0036C0DDE7